MPLAIRCAEAGHEVIGYDTDCQRVTALQNGESYVGDVSDEHLQSALRSGRYVPTGTIARCQGFDVAVLALPTPLRDTCPDLSYITAAARSIGPYIRRGALVILESTTHPGTTRGILAPLLSRTSGLDAGSAFHVGYSPERIDVGNKQWTVANIPKIVSGVNEESLTATASFYNTIVTSTVPVTIVEEAEFTKLLENTFRYVNIALMNELAVAAQAIGVNIWAAAEAAATKPFGFMPFAPGPGVGGHCLPVDPSYLSWIITNANGTARLIKTADEINRQMPSYVAERIIDGLQRSGQQVPGSRILLLGLGFKRNTGDVRESPAIRIGEILDDRGAYVFGVDPLVHDECWPENIKRSQLTPDEIAAADAVVLTSDHDIFDLDLVLAHARYIFDCRGRLHNKRNVEAI